MNTKTKTKQTRGKSEPQRTGKIMQGLVDNPDFILYNILKAMKA